MTNCCFGLSQLSLRNMYIAYIRSMLDYIALAQYPLVSTTNKNTIEKLEKRSLQKILEVLISIRIIDLYLEANINSIIIRWETSTAY